MTLAAKMLAAVLLRLGDALLNSPKLRLALQLSHAHPQGPHHARETQDDEGEHADHCSQRKAKEHLGLHFVPKTAIVQVGMGALKRDSNLHELAPNQFKAPHDEEPLPVLSEPDPETLKHASTLPRPRPLAPLNASPGAR